MSAIGLLRLWFRIEFNFVCIYESSDEGRCITYGNRGVICNGHSDVERCEYGLSQHANRGCKIINIPPSFTPLEVDDFEHQFCGCPDYSCVI